VSPKALIVSVNVDRPEREIFVGLLKHGFHLKVVCEATSPHQEYLSAAGIEVANYTFKSRFSLTGISYLRSVLTEGDFDLVHFFNNRALSNGLIALYLLSSKRKRIKSFAYRGTVGHLSRWDPLSWATYLNPRLDMITCVSKSVADYLSSLKIPAEKIITIYKGHHPDWYGCEAAARADLGFTKKDIIVCCAASIRPVKGVPYLMQAVASLQGSISNLRLLLIGDIRDKEVLKLLKDPTYQIFTTALGRRSDTSSLVAMSDIFVMPSIEREGLAKATIEAMCQRKPQIVTNVGGMPELIEDGVSGIVIPPKDTLALADSIFKLAQSASLRKEYGDKGYERILGEFNISKSIINTAELYKKVCNA
jgi:glycosyltransferase involved in cell wall biosynthesis